METSHLIWNLPTYNQAALTGNDLANFTFDYRQSTLSGGIKYTNTSFWGDYPLLQKGENVGAIYFSLENEISGSDNKFKKFKSNFALSKKVSFSKYGYFNFGLGVEYQQQTLSLDNLTTGSQFIEGIGFNRTLENGEASDFYKATYFAINSGIHLHTMDASQTKRMTIGFSVNNINKPIKTWEGIDNTQPLLWSGQFQYLTFVNPKFAVGPEAFLFKEGPVYNGIGGVMARYYLGSSLSASFDEEFDHQYLNIFMRVATQKKISLGLQYHQENYLVGASADLPFGNLNELYQNAFEIVIAFSPRIKSRDKTKRQKERKEESHQQNNRTKETKTDKEPASTEKATAGDEQSKFQISDTVTTATNDSDTTILEGNKTSLRAGSITSEGIAAPVDFTPVYFIFGSSELDSSSKAFLKDLYDKHIKTSHFIIELTGHTDNVGTKDINKELSLSRANQVKKYLVKLGAIENSITTKGVGDEKPKVSNNTKENRARNRRVEIRLILIPSK